ncbi:ABC transporter ATP-binding protein [Staphylococcus simulans]
MIKYIKRRLGLSKQGTKNYIISVIFEILNNVVNMFPMILFIYFLYDIEQFINHPQFGTIDGSIYLTLVGVVFILMYIFNYLSYSSNYINTYKESQNTRMHIAEKLYSLPVSYFSRKSAAETSNILLNDIADLEMYLSNALPKITGLIPIVALFLIGLSTLNFTITLIGFLIIPLSYLVFVISKKYELNAYERYLNTLTHQSEQYQEQIDMIKETRLLNQREQSLDKIKSLLRIQEKAHMNTEIPGVIAQGLMSILLKSGIGIVMITASFYFAMHKISFVLLIIFLIAFSRLYSLIVQIYELLAITRYVKVRINRINELLNEPEVKGCESPDDDHLNFIIENLNFAYEEHPVLKNLNFKIEEKTITAIVGPSGSGKTTLLRVLAKLYEYNSGNIYFGKHKLENLSPSAFYQKVSVVFQEVTLFDTTIMENIRIGNQNATDEAVIQAAKMARCDEFIRRLPKGYQTVIGENGSRLSGGERQRLSIARAFLKDAPILFLDEISASLDSLNEYEVQKALTQLVRDKTVIVVAHRLKTIENADNIIVLNQGEMVEEGSKEELLRKEKGLFAKMYHIENAI